MITARTPFQIFKAENPLGSVASFSSLAAVASLPFKVRAAEEALIASLGYVDVVAENVRPTYTISVLHACAAYLTQLVCFAPLLSRSTRAEPLELNANAIVRTVLLAPTHTDAVAEVMALLADASVVELKSMNGLTRLEDVVIGMEKEERGRAKERGEAVVMLRKVAPEKEAGPGATATSLDTSPGGDAADLDDAVEENNSVAVSTNDVGSLKRARSATSKGVGIAAKRKARADAAPAASPFHFGRLRALSTSEKKATAVLGNVITLLGHIYATKFNELLVIFDHIRTQVEEVQALMDADREAYESKEVKKPPPPFFKVELADLQRVLHTVTHTFQEDEDCRFELDEDLIHILAHACLSVVNAIEGYTTDPYQEPTEEEVQRKAALRTQAREKRLVAERKQQDRLRVKEEMANKKLEEKRQLRQNLGLDEDNLVEDLQLARPQQLGYVHYPTSPLLPSNEVMEKAIFVWAMISSIPRQLNLSQMPFATFVKGLLEEDEGANGLMEEVVRCLVDVAVEHMRTTSPNSPRMNTRGKSWFESLVTFVSVASGSKQRRQRQLELKRKQSAKASRSDDDDEDEDEDDEGDDDDDDDDDTSSETMEEEEEKGGSDASNEATTQASETEAASSTEAKPENEEAEDHKAEEEEEEVPQGELAATMERISALRNMATWGNVPLVDRLRLLEFCVHEVLMSDAVREEADRLQQQMEEELAATEKRKREICDEAEKEIKVLWRSHPSSSKRFDVNDVPAAEDGPSLDERKAQILADAQKACQAAQCKLYARQDGKDDGAIITPIGSDRYHRLYWRLPMDRHVLVQATPSTPLGIPHVNAPPEFLRGASTAGRSSFLDDEEAEEKALLSSKPQTDKEEAAWGIIPVHYLPHFIATLDPRGEREAVLRKALSELIPYLQKMEEPHEGRITTRSRQHTFGYINQLKPPQFL